MTGIAHFVDSAAGGQWALLGVVLCACLSALWTVWCVVSAIRDTQESNLGHQG